MLAVSSVRIISTGEEALVERLGRFERRLHPGLSFVIPGIERVSIYASIREQVLDVPPQPCITSDNAPLSADAVVFFRIKDLARARYAVDDFRACVTNLVLTQLRSEIGQLTLDQTFAARERLNQKLLEEANAVAAGWGIDVTRIEARESDERGARPVRDIHPSPEIVSSMEMQMAAERKKRAAILQSEGEKAALINAAEGRREATVLGARGEQERLQMEAERTGQPTHSPLEMRP
ncbi:putative stomatin-like protein [Emiliania huxleyi CCMP1516]|uniref:Band 7 domain-containing protein n=2 Tax=Emiliania huxleyi TaxID=2903 RepID=A0A0D3I4U4_EMIH1|nr:putative stomatin-like protein [Emiliania huxleyi CCMP1516]XP_005760843.1 putative stomatin-like protein [Emiliania huxleyi CCMP1516]EOD06279.1 putative stomatin-like protein [Emiliania huxleyi CCMP1516]EOD08414.1 putative stomatin-like protein [Emiliania huxleyi CCMP1516]|eukprot:XP_005758708.1 putative stomatin-like protein [Emiliania huxleyi CCMP1516]